MKTIRVVAAVIRDQDRIFATARGYGDYKGGWEFPGGKIESGETQKSALCREISEELGIQLDEARLVFVAENLHKYPHREIRIFLWKCAVNEKPHLTLSDHDKAEWFFPEEIGQINLSEGDKFFKSLI